MLAGVLTAGMGVEAGELKVAGVEFVYRAPGKYDEGAAVMVLFGGRNWEGAKTLKAFWFDGLADRYGVFLLSPSFSGNDYWEPAKGSGEILKKALRELEKRYRLKSPKLYFYGYSAGGQCANLYYAWMPERVAAWGAHGCGYFAGMLPEKPVPALVTCGTSDAERFNISRTFACRYRERGGELLWKFDSSGHELSAAALKLARAWFAAQMEGKKAVEYGEDDTGRIGGAIDPEYRNPLPTREIRELWVK